MVKFRLMAALLLGGALAVGVAPVDAARDRKKEEKATVSKTGREDKKPQSSQKFVKTYGKIADLYEADQYDEALAGLAKLETPKSSAKSLVDGSRAPLARIPSAIHPAIAARICFCLVASPAASTAMAGRRTRASFLNRAGINASC